MIKICGTTSLADAQLAARAGADCIGIIVNHPASPRHVTPETARAIADSVEIPVVAVSVNQSVEALLQIAAELRPRALQLHGDEPPELVRELGRALGTRDIEIWKAIAGTATTLHAMAREYTEAGASALIVDARAESEAGTVYGGTGHTVDWNAVRNLTDAGYRIILAGGLTPENVARAIEVARPWGVDVVSGVEARKGVKDPEKVRAFVRCAHRN